jgi:cellobiose transport system substrate-binding protein
MNPVLAQQPVGYFDTSDQLAMTSQPGVKTAWDTAMSVIDNKLSANLQAFSPDWNTGFKQGSFATIACPAWMLGYIQGQAPTTAGKWDIATIPGGGGNWGGSFLVLPKQGKHPKEAYELAAWLTDPAQTLQIFEKVGNLPSQVDLFTNPQVLASTNKFFSGAPVGKIFIATAQQLKPQYLGTKNGPVRQAVEADITLVQQGKLTPDAAWQKAVKDAEKAAG